MRRNCKRNRTCPRDTWPVHFLLVSITLLEDFQCWSMVECGIAHRLGDPVVQVEHSLWWIEVKLIVQIYTQNILSPISVNGFLNRRMLLKYICLGVNLMCVILDPKYLFVDLCHCFGKIRPGTVCWFCRIGVV